MAKSIICCLAISLMVSLYSGCQTKNDTAAIPAVGDSIAEITTTIATDSAPVLNKEIARDTIGLMIEFDFKQLDLDTTVLERVKQHLYATALFYDEVDPAVDYSDQDTTVFGSVIDFDFNLDFSNSKIVAIRTNRNWCAAYCDEDKYETVFLRQDGSTLPFSKLFQSHHYAEAFATLVEQEFQAELSSYLEELRSGSIDEQTHDEISALENYCLNWVADKFFLGETGLYFNEGCGLPHVIQAYEYYPELYYPYSTILGLSPIISPEK